MGSVLTHPLTTTRLAVLLSRFRIWIFIRSAVFLKVFFAACFLVFLVWLLNPFCAEQPEAAAGARTLSPPGRRLWQQTCAGSHLGSDSEHTNGFLV